MHFTSLITTLAITSTVLGDCTWPYCYYIGSYFYACESDADCLKLNITECVKGLESPTPSGFVCLPYGRIQANFTYVTGKLQLLSYVAMVLIELPESCIYPYCFNVQGWYSYGCDTNADCEEVQLTTCRIGTSYSIGFFSGTCY